MDSRPAAHTAHGALALHQELSQLLKAELWPLLQATLAGRGPDPSGASAESEIERALDLHADATVTLSNLAHMAVTEADARTALHIHDETWAIIRGRLRRLADAAPTDETLRAVVAEMVRLHDQSAPTAATIAALRVAPAPAAVVVPPVSERSTVAAQHRAPRFKRSAPAAAQPRRGSRMTRVVLGAAVAAALFLNLGAAAWRATAMQQRVTVAKEQLQGTGAMLSGVSSGATSPERLASACSSASSAEASLREVSDEIQPFTPLLTLLGSAPLVGDRTRTSLVAMQAGQDLASAGAVLCESLAPLAEVLKTGIGSGGSAKVLSGLAAARPNLRDALQRLDRAEQSLSALDGTTADLGAADGASLAQLRAKLPAVTRTLRDALGLLDLLGTPDQPTRRYLLVSQNNDELRASGGYIGSAGVVEVTGGQVRLAEYGSSRAYDTPAALRAVPPAPFARYLGESYWNLAAANWWPSFAADARQIAYFYGLTRPDQPVDGVIAMDQVGLARILEAVGPVDLPSYGERVDASNLQAKMDQYVHDYDTGTEGSRKQFTAAVSLAVLQRVLDGQRQEVPALLGALQSALDSQNMLIWTSRQEAADVLARNRWDGRLLPLGSGDGLMLVDTEVRTSKQSQSVPRTADYQVDLSEPGAPRARLAVTYRNLSDPTQRPGVQYFEDYRTYLRVYAPSGATLRASSGFREGTVDTHQECGRTVFAGEVVIMTGQTVQVNLDYTLPATVASASGYSLLVQQQPGIPSGDVRVRVQRGQDVVEARTAQAANWQLTPGIGGALAPRPLPTATAGDCPADVVQARPIAAPARMEIGKIGVNAAVTDLGVEQSGALEAPPTPEIVGWYRMSARAGQPGNAVFAGHLDWGKNTAVFWGLRDLVPGDTIVVRGADGAAYTYVVQWNESFVRDDAPMQRILGGTNEAAITLITCDGTYDPVQKDYSKRRVVRAVLQPA